MKSILTFFLFLLILMGCTSNDNEVETQDNEEITELILKSTSRLLVSPPNNNPPRIANFNQEGQIISTQRGDTILPYNRDDNGNLLSVQAGGFLTYYEDNKWIRSTYSSDTFWTETLVTYNGNLITLQRRDDSNLEEFYLRTEYTFEDDTYKKINVIETIINATDQVEGRTTYEYTGNNITRVYSEEFDQTTGESIPSREMIYFYDEQQNPYKKGLPENTALYLNLLFIEYGDPLEIAYLAENNIVRIDGTIFFNGSMGSTFFEYEYNELNYPISRVQSSNDVDQFFTEFEYY